MKKLLLTFTLLFSTLMFSTPSYAEWTEVVESNAGSTFYVDFDRIRKNGGYVYFWRLTNYLKPDSSGNLSNKSYYQGDCELIRHKWLTLSFFKEPMGEGTANTVEIPEEYKDWKYLLPDSSNEEVLIKVCSR